MNSSFHIKEKATEDLDEIWLYTFQKWSQSQADKYYWLLIEGIEFVASHFEAGKSIDDIKLGYRSFPVESHLIFYKQAEDKMIEIVRILHQSVDIKKHLI
ncbi:toxin ParE1 [Bacteroidia bacterium]|nr:toxin ParE1 [Bacteroidia bacterium]GHU79643.1 toxin ParE1 [Bacteroidia bacterium]